MPESSAVKELFTNNVAMNQCEDCKPTPPGPQKVSNLVRDPALNVKYDDAWFLKQNPQHWTNLRTMGLIKDLTKEEEDPIMKLNPTLYKVVQANKADESNFTDPFQKIMEQQSKWTSANKNYGYIKDVVYRSDLDHPNSMHNMTTNQNASM